VFDNLGVAQFTVTVLAAFFSSQVNHCYQPHSSTGFRSMLDHTVYELQTESFAGQTQLIKITLTNKKVSFFFNKKCAKLRKRNSSASFYSFFPGT
jgi:hypothetical protein